MPVYLTSPWIPAEWIKAHGLEPRGIWSEESFRHNALPLSAGVCAFAEMVLRFAEAQPDSAVIFTTSCDQMRRGFDTALVRGHANAFLFNLPATQNPTTKQMLRSELERLGKFLEELGGHAPKPEALQHEMHQAGKARQSLLESTESSSARSYAIAVAQFHRSGLFEAPQTGVSDGKVPLALVGGPLPQAHCKILEDIEGVGGRVVLNATETGERSLQHASESDDAANPFDTLVNGVFENIVDVFQRPNTRLYSWLGPRLKSRNVRGILLWHFTSCDLWRAEAQTLRDVFGLPVLLLEAGTESGAAPRDVNRIQAFVEMLK
jgi:benzoyl-CoA reductase/2-hydroxyglutaryl-CoA dehydratase subunit BcrC/BadD/HgdB